MKVEILQDFRMMKRALHHRFRAWLAVLFEKLALKATAIDANADRAAIGFRRADHFGDLLGRTDIARVDPQARRAAIGAGVAAAVAAPSVLAASRRSLLTADQLGWDAAAGEYTLPPLPYAYDALAPHIDAQTMEIHHSKHHAGYVRGLNRALAELTSARQARDAGLVKLWSREVSFHGAGHVNHTLFWYSMKPAGHGGGGGPTGPLAEAVATDAGDARSLLRGMLDRAEAFADGTPSDDDMTAVAVLARSRPPRAHVRRSTLPLS